MHNISQLPEICHWLKSPSDFRIVPAQGEIAAVQGNSAPSGASHPLLAQGTLPARVIRTHYYLKSSN